MLSRRARGTTDGAVATGRGGAATAAAALAAERKHHGHHHTSSSRGEEEPEDDDDDAVTATARVALDFDYTTPYIDKYGKPGQ